MINIGMLVGIFSKTDSFSVLHMSNPQDQKKGGRVTMRQIAKEAGVSQPTVSQALRNHPRISLATRKRVQDIALKMGYRFDPKIQELMGYLRKPDNDSYFGTIGLLLGFKKDWGTEEWPYYAYLEGAERRAEELGYKCERFFVREEGLSDKRLNDILLSRGIQGLVVFPFDKLGDPLMLQWKEFSSVLIGFNLLQLKLHRVMSDHFGSMQIVLSKLQERGFKRIAYASDERVERRLRYAWRSGFLLYQDRIDVDDQIPYFSYDEPGLDPNQHQQPPKGPFGEWLEQYKPEVVIGLPHSPHLTMVKLGIRMPEDIAYVTLDWKKVYHSELSGLDQLGEDIGATSVDKAVAMLQVNEVGIPKSPQFVSVSGKWHDGDVLLKV